MKKLLSTFLLASIVSVMLVGCGIPEGFSQDFWTDARTIFLEIDDDTQELENPDNDDVANLELLEVKVSTDKDEEVYDLLKNLNELNKKMLGDTTKYSKDFSVDKEYLKKYLEVRNKLEYKMGLDIFDFEFKGE